MSTSCLKLPSLSGCIGCFCSHLCHVPARLMQAAVCISSWIVSLPFILVDSVVLLVSFLLIMTIRRLLNVFESFCLGVYCRWARRVYLPKHRLGLKFTPSISFAGGGMYWTYYLGVGHYLYKHYDVSRIKFFCSSSGCFAAVPLALGWDPYDWCKRDWQKCLNHWNTRALGPLLDNKEFYYALWDGYLPADAHIRCSGRLHISITILPSLRNKVVSHFATRDELIWTIIASCCLPVLFMRTFPSTKYGLSVDGGFTNDQPCCDQYTITVSALNYLADIHPRPDRALSALELVFAPSYDRVWQISAMGEDDARLCVDFEREEWREIRIPDEQLNSSGLLTIPQPASTTSSSSSTDTARRRPRSRSSKSHSVGASPAAPMAMHFSSSSSPGSLAPSPSPLPPSVTSSADPSSRHAVKIASPAVDFSEPLSPVSSSDSTHSSQLDRDEPQYRDEGMLSSDPEFSPLDSGAKHAPFCPAIVAAPVDRLVDALTGRPATTLQPLQPIGQR